MLPSWSGSFHTHLTSLDFISSQTILPQCLREKNRDHLTLRDIGVATRCLVVQSFVGERVLLLRATHWIATPWLMKVFTKNMYQPIRIAD